jgi:hypothetical protein
MRTAYSLEEFIKQEQEETAQQITSNYKIGKV